MVLTAPFLGLLAAFAEKMVKRLAKSIDPDTVSLAKALEDKNVSDNEKESIIQELIQKVQKDKNSAVRAAAILGLFQVEEAIYPIYNAMIEDKDEYVRNLARYVIGVHSSKQGYRNIEEFVRSTLPEIRRKQTIKEFIIELHSKKTAKRKEAIWNLGDMGAKEAIPHLKELAIRDKNIRVRAWAAFVLGQIGGEVILDLEKILNGTDEQLVRLSAALALSNLGKKTIIRHVKEELLSKINEELIDERVAVVSSPPRENWWKRQKPIVRDLIKGAIGALLGAIIGGSIGLLI